jgi:hypothetical protein
MRLWGIDGEQPVSNSGDNTRPEGPLHGYPGFHRPARTVWITIDELTPGTLTTPLESCAAVEAELEAIAKAIEQGDIAIDKLRLAVKGAGFLNRHLEQQLVNLEQDLKQLGPQAGLGKASHRKE